MMIKRLKACDPLVPIFWLSSVVRVMRCHSQVIRDCLTQTCLEDSSSLALKDGKLRAASSLYPTLMPLIPELPKEDGFPLHFKVS